MRQIFCIERKTVENHKYPCGRYLFDEVTDVV